MTFPKVDELVSRVALADIIGARVALKKQGAELVGLCPFHNEKTPSFTVYSGTGGAEKFHCFGCGKSGNAIDFLMETSGLSLIEAKDELARMIGGGDIPTATNTPTDRRPDPAPADVWRTTFPIEGDDFKGRAYSPKRDTWADYSPSMTFPYRNAGGVLLGYVIRLDKSDGGKITPQITYCENIETGELRWCARHFDTPRPLYNLQNLKPTGTVLIVEGEKCVDSARRLVGDKVSVIGWPGGGNGVKFADWGPLKGRRCVIWPDADQKTYPDNHDRAGELMPFSEQPGGKCAEAVRDHVQGDALIITPSDVVDGWDVADAESDGWTGAEVWEFLTKAVKAARSDNPPAEPTEPPNDAAPPHGPDDADGYERDDGLRDPFVPLGYNGDRFYYLSRRLRTVESLTASQHNDRPLLRLAPLDHWEASYPGKQGPNWMQAANVLITNCSRAGFYDPERIRGRGAWYDDGRAVFHFGDQLIVDGESVDPIDFSDESRFVYPANSALVDVTAAKPLTNAESAKVLETAKSMRWGRPASAYLCAGWVALAPICGALPWRPHIWITGAAGSGKSTILTEFVEKLTGEISLFSQGATTAAGIRQTLKDDALPVILDEAEGDTQAAVGRLTQLLELMRSSASDTGAKTFKGSAGHSAIGFNIRSMFALGSISPTIKNHADESRIVELELKVPAGGDWKENERHWQDLQRRLAEVGTDDFARRLVARTIQNIPTIRANVATFRRAAAAHFGNQRHGDTLGVLLAGAFSLTSKKAIEYDAAVEFVESQDWSRHIEADDGGDETALLSYLLAATFTIQTTNHRFETNIGEAIARAAGVDNIGDRVSYSASDALGALSRRGIKVEAGGEDFIIANRHPELTKIFKESTHPMGWNSIFGRIPGALKHDGTSFAGGTTQRAAILPITILNVDQPGLI